MDKQFFLIGFMASGKSTTGKKLASHFGFEFIDLDDFIELCTGKSISTLFAELGEDGFRKLESKSLKALPPGDKIVATGGGTPCFFKNLDWMKENGIVVYLKKPAEMLIGRLRQKKADRPLVSTLSDEALTSFVQDKLAERRPFYEQADITFSPVKSLAMMKMELNFILEMSKQ